MFMCVCVYVKCMFLFVSLSGGQRKCGNNIAHMLGGGEQHAAWTAEDLSWEYVHCAHARRFVRDMI